MKLIHRKTAKALLKQGETIHLCPSNLSPLAFNRAFATPIQFAGNKAEFEDWFKRVTNQFRYYNCQSSETGYCIKYWQA